MARTQLFVGQSINRWAGALLAAVAATSCSASGQGRAPISGSTTTITVVTDSNPTRTTPSGTTTTTPEPPISIDSMTTQAADGVERTTTSTIPVTSTTAPVTNLPASESPIYDVRPPSNIAPPDQPADWSTEVVGTTTRGLEIVALVRPVEAPRRRVIVIGGLHGNEPVTPPTVRALVEARHDADVEVWLVPEANPEGVAAGTRWNGNGVDLNRNFSWGWSESDGGPGPLSEPETTALVALIERLRPDVVVWVHQPYGYTSSIGPTDRALEQSWAEASGVPVRSGVTQHGGGESWTAFVAGFPSMLVEIDSWSATPEIVAAHRAGYEAMLATLG